MGNLKKKLIFQPSFFRGELLNFGRCSYFCTFFTHIFSTRAPTPWRGSLTLSDLHRGYPTERTKSGSTWAGVFTYIKIIKKTAVSTCIYRNIYQIPLILFGYERSCYLKMCYYRIVQYINYIYKPATWSNDQWTMDSFVNFWTAKNW